MTKKIGTSNEGSNAIEQIVIERIMYWKGIREFHKKPYHENKNELTYQSGVSFSINNIVNDINRFCKENSQDFRLVIEKP